MTWLSYILMKLWFVQLFNWRFKVLTNMNHLSRDNYTKQYTNVYIIKKHRRLYRTFVHEIKCYCDATQGVVWIRCAFWRTLKIMLEYIQPMSLSSYNSINTFCISTQLSPTQSYELNVAGDLRKSISPKVRIFECHELLVSNLEYYYVFVDYIDEELFFLD